MDEEIYTGVGKVAQEAAVLEHALFDAIVRFFEEKREQAELLVQDKSASALIAIFEKLYHDAPEIAARSSSMRNLLERRNTVVHSQEIMSFGNEFPFRRMLANRRKRGKEEPLPTVDELSALSKELEDASGFVWFVAETRDFGYDYDKLEQAIEEDHKARFRK